MHEGADASDNDVLLIGGGDFQAAAQCLAGSVHAADPEGDGADLGSVWRDTKRRLPSGSDNFLEHQRAACFGTMA